MNRLKIFCTVMVLCGIWNTAAGASPQALPDSVVTEDNVYRYMFSDTEKAEAIMEALRVRKQLPDWELDYTEGDLWFNTGRYYRALKCYGRVLESSKAKKDNTLYMDMLHRMISCYDCIHNEARKAEYMELLLNRAEACGDKAMQAVALFNIGKSQYNQGSKESGYRHMEEATRMMEATDYRNKYDNLRYHYNTLLVYYEKDHRGEEALRTLDALEKVVASATGQETGIDGLDEKERKAFYGHRTVVYNILGRNAEADESYRQFISLGKPTDRDNYLVMPYLFDRRKYDEILRISHLREQLLRSQADTINYHMVSIFRQLGRAYYETGDYQAAADNFARLATLRDSIKNREQQSAVLELAEVYESGEKDKTILHQQQQTRILLAVTAIVLAVVAIVAAYNRRIRRRNASLVRAVSESLACKDELWRKEEECRTQKREIETLKKQVEDLEHTNESLSRSLAPADGKKSGNAELLEQVLYEIVNRQLYLQPGINAKAVHEILQVPVSLFGTFFEQQKGKRFTDYINELRMNHAARLLIEHPHYTIDAVAKMCGIDSRQHFHRLFSDIFSITPSAFRKGHEATGNKQIVPDKA